MAQARNNVDGTPLSTSLSFSDYLTFHTFSHISKTYIKQNIKPFILYNTLLRHPRQKRMEKLG